MSETSTTNSGDSGEQTLSIGALSRATGIPVETIRTWERRYGFPDPDRNAAGHRIFSLSTVEHLRLVDRALEQGHRPSNVLKLDRAELEEMLGVAGRPSDMDAANGATTADVRPREGSEEVAGWLDAAASFDGEAFENELRGAWHELGAMRFIVERVGPFLTDLGNAWAERRIDVSNEHFASERLRDFLTSQWRPMSDRAQGPRLVLTTLPGEDHSLGLQMAAMVLALAGCRVIYLGSNTPVVDIVEAAARLDASAVAVSMSVAANRFMASRDLASLRESLGDDVDVIVGGRGAAEGLEGVRYIDDYEELLEDARQLVRDDRDGRADSEASS